MLIGIVSLVFLLLAIRGFARVVRYFWDWLRGGEKIADAEAVALEEDVERAVAAVVERDLAGIGDLPATQRAAQVIKTGTDAVEEYLDDTRLGWWQVVMVFFVGCMAGLLIEEVWMLVTAGLTESRVGLVWGPFSPLYGFGATLLTVICFELRRRGAVGWQVFVVSMLVGGTLEQLTGWGMETLFDAQSWTYAHLPDAITQWVAWRFLVFWGLLGLVWYRLVMPPLLYRIGMPTTRRQAVFITLLAIYLAADMGMTVACFARKAARDEGVPPANAFEEWVDGHYSDEFIAGRFQNLVIGRDL